MLTNLKAAANEAAEGEINHQNSIDGVTEALRRQEQ